MQATQGYQQENLWSSYKVLDFLLQLFSRDIIRHYNSFYMLCMPNVMIEQIYSFLYL